LNVTFLVKDIAEVLFFSESPEKDKSICSLWSLCLFGKLFAALSGAMDEIDVLQVILWIYTSKSTQSIEADHGIGF